MIDRREVGVIASNRAALQDQQLRARARVPPLYAPFCLGGAHEGGAALSAVDSATRSEPAGRRFADSFLVIFGSGRTLELGRRMIDRREVGGHRQRAALQDQQLRARARVPPLYPLTRAHEGRAALSAVDSATRSEPAGRRFADSFLVIFGSGRTLELGRRMIDRREVGGHRQRAALQDQQLRARARVPPLYPLTRAHEGRAALSAVDSATRSEPAGRRFADSFLVIFGSGRTLELGRRMIDRREVGGHRQRAALQDQQLRARARVPPLYPLTRAHEGRAALSAVDSATRSEPAGRRFADFFLVIFGSGRTLELGRRMIDRREAGGHRQRAALQDQQLRARARVPPLYPLPRAHEGGAALSAVDSATRSEPAGRRFADSFLVIFGSGRTLELGRRMIDRREAGGHRQRAALQDQQLRARARVPPLIHCLARTRAAPP